VVDGAVSRPRYWGVSAAVESGSACSAEGNLSGVSERWWHEIQPGTWGFTSLCFQVCRLTTHCGTRLESCLAALGATSMAPVVRNPLGTRTIVRGLRSLERLSPEAATVVLSR
jgi:hypothetical protein